MKVFQANFSDTTGGAARAAFRLHAALTVAGIESELHVVKALSGEWSVFSPRDSAFGLGRLVRPQIAGFVSRLHRGNTRESLSLALCRSRWPRLMNRSTADLVQLHWVCGEMMSIEDIARVRKPIVWTLHDMWAFCGAEHCSYDNRWRTGYEVGKRPSGEGGIDLNRWVWGRKKVAWTKPLQIVAPSRWLASCVTESALMSAWPVVSIPNALDTDAWSPIDRSLARRLLGLPTDQRLVAFGGMGGGVTYNKGFDLMLSALNHLRELVPDVAVVVFGQRRPKVAPELRMPSYYMGHLYDDLSLRALYSAVDLLMIPSRIDNLPNTGVEAMACGTPVVAFNIGGLPDIVSHRETGWLAQPFDVVDFAEGARWLIEDETRHKQLSETSRIRAIAKFSYPIVAAQYKSLYERVCSA